jgi:hypothetical protein
MVDKVREQLERMSKNFAGLAGQFEVVGMAAGKAAAALGKPIARLSGQLAARQDWGSKLWPEDQEEEEDDGGRV